MAQNEPMNIVSNALLMFIKKLPELSLEDFPSLSDLKTTT